MYNEIKWFCFQFEEDKSSYSGGEEKDCISIVRPIQMERIEI